MDKESPAVWRGSREPRVNFWRNVNSKATLRPVTFLVPKKIKLAIFLVLVPGRLLDAKFLYYYWQDLAYRDSRTPVLSSSSYS